MFGNFLVTEICIFFFFLPKQKPCSNSIHDHQNGCHSHISNTLVKKKKCQIPPFSPSLVLYHLTDNCAEMIEPCIFNLVSTKLNTVSVLIWPLHLRSPVPKNKRAIVPFLWLGLIFGMGFRAVSVLSIIWTGSKTNLNLIFFLDSSKRLEHIVKGAI